MSSSINSEISLICVREADHFTLVFHRCCPYVLRYDLAPPRNRAGIARGDRGHAGNIEVHFRVEWGYLSNRSGIDRVVFLSSRWDGPSSRILQYIIFRSAGDHFGIDKSNPTPPGISVYRTETSSSAVGVDESFMFTAYTRKKKRSFRTQHITVGPSVCPQRTNHDHIGTSKSSMPKFNGRMSSVL